MEFERWLEANGAARGMTDEDVQALFRSVDVDNSGVALLSCFPRTVVSYDFGKIISYSVYGKHQPDC